MTMRRLVLTGWLCLSLAVQARQQEVPNEALAEKAVEAERRGDFAGAVAAFEQLLKDGTDSPQLRNNLGIAYFQLGRYDDALKQFRRVLASNQGSLSASLFSGLSLLKLQRPKEARLFLVKAETAQPDSPDVLIALAQADAASHYLSEASSLYQRVTRLQPNNADAWYGVGITNRALAEQTLKSSGGSSRVQAQQFIQTANAALARAVDLDPHSVGSYMILGESFRIAEEYDQAVEEYEAATQRKPDFAPAWAGLAQAYSAAGRDNEALKAANSALALDPNDAGTNVLIAATYLRLSDLPHAKEYALRAIKLQPELSSAHVVLAKCELQEKEPDQALPELRAAVKDDLDGSTYYLLATTLRQLGKTAEAAAAMQNYKRLHAMHVGSNPAVH